MNFDLFVCGRDIVNRICEANTPSSNFTTECVEFFYLVQSAVPFRHQLKTTKQASTDSSRQLEVTGTPIRTFNMFAKYKQEVKFSCVSSSRRSDQLQSMLAVCDIIDK